MRDNNKGLSLVELIVVIAIMAILVGVMAFSYSIVTGKEAQECARNIGTSLDKAKNYSMVKSGMSDAYLLIRKESNGYFAEYYIPDGPVAATYHMAESDGKKLGKRTVEIALDLSGSGTYTLNDGNAVRIFFNRVTGAFKGVQCVSHDNSDVVDPAAFEICNSITVKRGKIYQIDFVISTGKHTLKRIS